MDPLSGIASVIAVIQLTTAIVSICYGYRRTTKHASRDIKHITEELDSLGDVLKRLLLLLESEEAEGTTQLQTLSLLEEPLKQCHIELEALKTNLLSGASDGFMRAIGQVLIWPLKEGDIKKSINRLEKFKALLGLALTVDHT